MRKRLNGGIVAFLAVSLLFFASMFLLPALFLEKFFLMAGLILLLLPVVFYNHPYRKFVRNMERQGFVRNGGIKRHRRVGGVDLAFEYCGGFFPRLNYRVYPFVFTANVRIPSAKLKEYAGMTPWNPHFEFWSKEKAVRAFGAVVDEKAAEAAGRLFDIGSVRKVYANRGDGTVAVEMKAGSTLRYYELEPGDIEKMADFFSALKRAGSKRAS